MSAILETFSRRINGEWLPSYQAERGHLPGEFEFQQSSIRVSEHDAREMMRVFDAGLVSPAGRGNYRFPRSQSVETLFWEGRKDRSPRSIRLWLEPVITIAAIGKLHFDFGWPLACLGSQSAKGEFDLFAFDQSDSVVERVAGEVKNSDRGLEEMLAYLERFSGEGCTVEPSKDMPIARNAFRKWVGLRDRKIPYFWAIGPADRHHFFEMNYRADGTGAMTEVSSEALAYRP